MSLYQAIYRKSPAIALFGLCVPTFAGSNAAHLAPASDQSSQPHSSFVFTLSGGPAWLKGANRETFYLEPGIEKTYAAKKSTYLLGAGELFLGFQREVNAHIQGQIGVAVAGTGDTKVSGKIWDDSIPAFDNYNYSYNVQHWHVALKGKALTETILQLKPYISGSVGVGFNQSSHFINTPTIFEAVEMPNFTSHTMCITA